MLVRTALAAITVIWIATATAAQSLGNFVVVNGTRVVEVLATGGSSVLATWAGGEIGLAACPTADNRGVAILAHTLRNQQYNYHLIELRGGVLSTLGTASRPAGIVARIPSGSIVLDQRGDYLATTGIGLLRFDALTGNATTVATAAREAMCEHWNTGGWLTYSVGSVYTRPRQGRETLVASTTGPTVIAGGDLFPDPVTGDAYLAYGALSRVDVARGTITPVGRTLGATRCGLVDTATGDLVVGTTSALLRVNSQGAVVSTMATLIFGAAGVAHVGSHHLPGAGAALPGTTYGLLVSFPGESGRPYLLAASFGFRPGIPTGVGPIPLVPDALFVLSQRASTVFNGFAGFLNANGEAGASIAIPPVPALRGLLTYVAAIVHDGNGTIRQVSAPRTLVIE